MPRASHPSDLIVLIILGEASRHFFLLNSRYSPQQPVRDCSEHESSHIFRSQNVLKLLAFSMDPQLWFIFWSPNILRNGTRWRWVISFTPRPLYSQVKSRWYPLDRRLSRYGRGDEGKNSQTLPALEPPIVQPVAQRYTTELSRLITKYFYPRPYGMKQAAFPVYFCLDRGCT
jgi:hypothetical protein